MKFTILALFLLSSSLLDAATVNYKNKYCQKKKFVTSKKQTPPLHCDKNFILLKHKRGGEYHHEYFAKGNIIRCAKLFKVLEDPSGFGAFYRFSDIEKSMMDFAVNECNRIEEEKEQFESALVEYNKAKGTCTNKMNNQNKKYRKPRTQFINKQNENIGKDTKQEKDPENQEKEDKGTGNNQQCEAL